MRRPITRSRLLYPTAAIVILLSLLGSVAVLGQASAQQESPVGQWSVALSRPDIPVDVASSFSYVGRWRLGINADGTYDAQRTDVGTVVIGSWTVDGDQITFTDEEGLLSCANAAAAPIINDDLDSGTYTWVRTDKTLTLTRVDDACPGRVILLSTFAFSPFVACTTQPMTISELTGTPEASPTVQNEPVIAASPIAGSATFASEIDDLLGQLTACWASREPERWLPLLSNEFRQALLQSDPNFLETLSISMSSPIVWARSGDITFVAANQLSAIVKSTVGTEEDFQRFVFIFENGQWKWNG